MSLSYRRAEPEDVRFVVSTWLDSYRASKTAGIVPMDRWAEIMTPVVQGILNRPGCETWVSYWEGETDRSCDLKGWIAVERGIEVMTRRQISGRWEDRLVETQAPLVHYLYVRQAWRLQGIARGLLKAAGVDPEAPFYFTCTTAALGKVQKRGLIRQATWSPLIARHPKIKPQEIHSEARISEDHHVPQGR